MNSGMKEDRGRNEYLDSNDMAAGTLQLIDDGCDWCAWLVWSMNARRRISESLFSLPPMRPLVAKPVAKKKKRTRKPRKALSLFTDQLMS